MFQMTRTKIKYSLTFTIRQKFQIRSTRDVKVFNLKFSSYYVVGSCIHLWIRNIQRCWWLTICQIIFERKIDKEEIFSAKEMKIGNNDMQILEW